MTRLQLDLAKASWIVGGLLTALIASPGPGQSSRPLTCRSRWPARSPRAGTERRGWTGSGRRPHLSQRWYSLAAEPDGAARAILDIHFVRRGPYAIHDADVLP